MLPTLLKGHQIKILNLSKKRKIINLVMKIEYRFTVSFGKDLKSLAMRSDVNRICDIGGGANPLLPLDFINDHGLDYTVLDISEEELAKAPDGYKKIKADITDPNLDIDLDRGYDLVVSKFLAEHIKSGYLFHKNILRLLREGGYAFHFFPTLYDLPFLLNLIAPENLADSILLSIAPHRTKEGNQGKFPAYYSWCRGPTKTQIAKFENLGYVVESYVGIYGAPYLSKIPLIGELKTWLSHQLVEHPTPWLTSYAQVLLRKNSP